MKRNFPNFLEAYFNYAKDGFCPNDFHTWTGLSIIAGSLERKVFLQQGLIKHFPNIYTLLVSHPGVGKSTALDRGTELIELLKQRHNPELKLIPNQITEPALLDLMNIRAQMPGTGSQIIYHSSGYFYASEASASALQNLHGDFNATITALYDCPTFFRKKLKMDKELIEIPHACMNVLAGATFDYLKELVNERSVMGGLASRFIYVINKDRIVRQAKWGYEQEVDVKTKNLLVEDLATINRLVGPFKPTKGFMEQWEHWQPTFDKYLIDLNSPRMESINARKGTNILKAAMLLSVSESNSMELNCEHWEKAVDMINKVTKDNAFVIASALMASVDVQAGINQNILLGIGNKIGDKISTPILKQKMIRAGIDSQRFDSSFQKLREASMIKFLDSGGDRVELLVNPEGNL